MNGKIEGNLYLDFQTGKRYRIEGIVTIDKYAVTYLLSNGQKLTFNSKTNQFKINN